MKPVTIGTLVGLFAKGAAMAVSIYLLWKKNRE